MTETAHNMKDVTGSDTVRKDVAVVDGRDRTSEFLAKYLAHI
jgi:hypothetical protein